MKTLRGNFHIPAKMEKRSDESILGYPLYQLQTQGQVVHVDLERDTDIETKGERDRETAGHREKDEGGRDESVFSYSYIDKEKDLLCYQASPEFYAGSVPRC